MVSDCSSCARTSGEITTDKGQQMERWVEHYCDLYSRENTVSPAALDVIECLLTMDDLDSEPSVGEHRKTIVSLASGNAPGNNGITPELIKQCKTILLLPLHELICQSWREGAVPRGREERLYQLQRHLPTQHCRQSICSGHSDTPPEADGAYLHGVTMWLSS